MILAIDPGKEKCGLAVLDQNGKTLKKKVIAREEAAKLISQHVAEHGISTLVIGRSSFGKAMEKELLKLDLPANLIFVSEKHSTLEARKRYWQENRPRGLWRLVPTTLRVPPVPIDDYAAVILGERYLKG
jgi:RNase H-fold protein (predicted Holliday junction resolvase)